MQVSNVDFQSSNLQTHFASDALRENPHGRRALNAEEEAKVEELKAQEANAHQEEQVEIKQVEETQKSAESGHNQHDGHAHADHTQHDTKAHSLASSDAAQKRIEEELLKQKENKARFFDSSGQTSKPRPESSVVDVFG